jgi:uncharacterized protein DUF11
VPALDARPVTTSRRSGSSSGETIHPRLSCPGFARTADYARGFPADNPDMLITAALLAGLLSVVPQTGSADLSVDLDARHTIVLAGANYDVTVTNNGPDALESATVVMQFEAAPIPGSAPANCTVNQTAKTLTCALGTLAVGASVTRSITVYYSYGGLARQIYTTATRTASTPVDPNQANDSDMESCYYDGSQGIPSTGQHALWC